MSIFDNINQSSTYSYFFDKLVVWLSDTSFNFVVSFKFIEFLIGLDTDRQLINIADDFIKEVKEVLNKTRKASQSNIFRAFMDYANLLCCHYFY